MALQRFENYVVILLAIACLAASSFAVFPGGYQGQVSFNGFAVPGVTVTATQDDKKFVAITDETGTFTFPDVTNGTWTIQVEMSGFVPMKDQVLVGANAPAAPPWELKMLALDDMKAEVRAATPAPATSAAPAQPTTDNATAPAKTAAVVKPGAKTDSAKTPAKPGAPGTPAATPGQDAAPPAAAAPVQETDQRANDGFLINGSVNNGASSPFAQLNAFGNSRAGGRSLYNGGIGFTLDNSALDASPFSLTGTSAPKAAYNQITGAANFGGPIKIPHLIKNGPTFIIGYQIIRMNNDTVGQGLVPTLAERTGDLSAISNPIYNPATGLPFLNNMIPVSPQAASLLNLYPQPNLIGNPQFNYQAPIVSDTSQDRLSVRLSKTVGRKDSFSGTLGLASTRLSTPNLFGFVDTTDSLGINFQPQWSHRFSPRLGNTLTYQFSRYAVHVIPNFENVTNISGAAGITGNNQDPTNWGPPALNFSSITGLSDGQSSHNRTQNQKVGDNVLWTRRNHNLQMGGDINRREINILSQQDPRGTFQFTGAATEQMIGGVAQPGTGSDLADFLLGIPDSSSIAFGNADKYFRQTVYDAYVDDDWRVTPQLSVHLGARWEYGSPYTELFGRLVNLDVTPTFSAIAPVIASSPTGTLTNQAYPNSLIRPDKHGIEPRLGVSWRPISGSSILVKAGYAINYDTSVYQSMALLMAQQEPLSKSLIEQNSAACPLTLENGFTPCTLSPAFGVDPNFRVGYVQTWQASVQRDLPWSLQMTATYLGNKGTRGAQEFLPNTNAPGAANPCPSCPVGFAFLTSNGNSNRESGNLQVRRRLRAGLTATLTYTYAKSIDDDSTIGGLGAAGASSNCSVCAQDWTHLNGQRGLSTFDQRHLVNFTWQYTTGMGIGGKTLMSGWKGRLYKEWTFVNAVTWGTGLPLSPLINEIVPGTGFSGTLRPDTTGAPIYATGGPSQFLNINAFALPPAGQFGTAGRDSITGPDQFSLNASMARSFHLKDRYSLSVEFDANNFLNHVTYTSYITNISQLGTTAALNPAFGTAVGTNSMRKIVSIVRLRF
jgi:trimeric autotransporter adhesin